MREISQRLLFYFSRNFSRGVFIVPDYLIVTAPGVTPLFGFVLHFALYRHGIADSRGFEVRTLAERALAYRNISERVRAEKRQIADSFYSRGDVSVERILFRRFGLYGRGKGFPP